MKGRERCKSSLPNQASVDSQLAGTASVGLLVRFGRSSAGAASPGRQRASSPLRHAASPLKQHLEQQDHQPPASKCSGHSFALLSLQPEQLLRAAQCQQPLNLQDSSTLTQQGVQLSVDLAEPQPQTYPGVVPQQQHEFKQQGSSTGQKQASHGRGYAAAAKQAKAVMNTRRPTCSPKRPQPVADRIPAAKQQQSATQSAAAAKQSEHEPVQQSECNCKQQAPASPKEMQLAGAAALRNNRNHLHPAACLSPVCAVATTSVEGSMLNAAAITQHAAHHVIKSDQLQLSPTSTAVKMLQQMRQLQEQQKYVWAGMHQEQQQRQQQRPAAPFMLQQLQSSEHDSNPAQHHSGFGLGTCHQSMHPLPLQQHQPQLPLPFVQCSPQWVSRGSFPAQQQYPQAEMPQQFTTGHHALPHQRQAQQSQHQHLQAEVPQQHERDQYMLSQQQQQQQHQLPESAADASAGLQPQQLLPKSSSEYPADTASPADATDTAFVSIAVAPPAEGAATAAGASMHLQVEAATQTRKQKIYSTQPKQSQQLSTIEKQELLLARMCAKHGLPLPQQTSLQAKQQHQQQGHTQQQKKLSSTAVRRVQLLKQLRTRSIAAANTTSSPSRQLWMPGGGAVPGPNVAGAAAAAAASSTGSYSSLPWQAAAAGACNSICSEGAAAESCCQQQQQQQELQLVGGWSSANCLLAESKTPASELHAVDGLQYVHALLSSIKLPGDQHGKQLHAMGGEDWSALVVQRPMQQERQQQEQQEHQQQVCIAALESLHHQDRLTGSSHVAGSGAASHVCQLENMQLQCSQGYPLQITDPPMQLEDALTLLCIATGSKQKTREDSCGSAKPQPPVHQAMHLATLHATAKQWMFTHGQAATDGHQPQQLHSHVLHIRQLQLLRRQRYSCRRLCIHAMGVIRAERLDWCGKQQKQIWRCLQQVGKELRQQQALAEAAKTAHTELHRIGNIVPRQQQQQQTGSVASATAAAEATAAVTSKQLRTVSPSRHRWELQQQQIRQQGPSPAYSAAVAAASKWLAKTATVAAVLAGKVNLKSAFKGWEGSGFVVRLLTELHKNLWCKLVLQVLCDASIQTSDLYVILHQRYSLALQQLQLSSAFFIWHAWATDRSKTRSKYCSTKRAVRNLKMRQVLAGWHGVAARETAVHAAAVVLQQRLYTRLLSTAHQSWRIAHAAWKVQRAQEAVAVLWHARVLSAKAIVAWTGMARRAGAIKAALHSSGSGSGGTPGGSLASSCYFQNCSSTFTEAIQQQDGWKASAIGAVASAIQQLQEAAVAAAAAAAAASRSGQLHAMRAAVIALQQKWQHDRQQQAAEQVQQLLEEEAHQKQQVLLQSGMATGGQRTGSDASSDSTDLSYLSSSASASICCQQSSEQLQQLTGDVAAAPVLESKMINSTTTNFSRLLLPLTKGERQQTPHNQQQQQQHSQLQAKQDRGDAPAEHRQEQQQGGNSDQELPQHQEGKSDLLQFQALQCLQTEQQQEPATSQEHQQHTAAVHGDDGHDTTSSINSSISFPSLQRPGKYNSSPGSRSGSPLPAGSTASSACCEGSPSTTGSLSAVQPQQVKGCKHSSSPGSRAGSPADCGGVMVTSLAENDTSTQIASATEVLLSLDGNVSRGSASTTECSKASSPSPSSVWVSSPGSCPEAQVAAAKQLLLSISGQRCSYTGRSLRGSGRRSPSTVSRAGLGVFDVVADNITCVQHCSDTTPVSATHGASKDAAAQCFRSPREHASQRLDGHNQTQVQERLLHAEGFGMGPIEHTASKLQDMEGSTADDAPTASLTVGVMPSDRQIAGSSTLDVRRSSSYSSNGDSSLKKVPHTLPLASMSTHRRVSQAINDYSLSVLCRKALQGFKGEMLQGRAAQHVALQHWRTVLLTTLIHRWARVAKHEHIKLRVATLRHFFARWASFNNLQQQKQQQRVTAVQHHLRTLLKAVLGAWQDQAIEKQRQGHLVQQCRRRQKLRVLGAWRETVTATLRIAAVIQQVRAAHLHRLLSSWRQQAADAAKHAKAVRGAASAHERMLLRRCLKQWAWPVRGRALLTRVFAAADSRWSAHEQHAKARKRTGTHSQDFQAMQLALHSWMQYTATQLQAAAARAAAAAASTHHSTKICTHAWHAWQLAVTFSHAARQQLALRACCFGVWCTYTRQQRHNPTSLIMLRRVIRVSTLGRCRTEQGWHQQRVVVSVMRAWAVRALILSGQQYRLQLLARAVAAWRHAVQHTQQLLLPFHVKWQRNTLLAKAVLLWRGLTLLLRHQRDVSAAVSRWREARMVTAALREWRGLAVAAVADQQQQLVGLQHYVMQLMKRTLQRWSLVSCVYSAARGYYQHRLMGKVCKQWRQAAAAAGSAAEAHTTATQTSEQPLVGLQATPKRTGAAEATQHAATTEAAVGTGSWCTVEVHDSCRATADRSFNTDTSPAELLYDQFDVQQDGFPDFRHESAYQHVPIRHPGHMRCAHTCLDLPQHDASNDDSIVHSKRRKYCTCSSQEAELAAKHHPRQQQQYAQSGAFLCRGCPCYDVMADCSNTIAQAGNGSCKRLPGACYPSNHLQQKQMDSPARRVGTAAQRIQAVCSSVPVYADTALGRHSYKAHQCWQGRQSLADVAQSAAVPIGRQYNLKQQFLAATDKLKAREAAPVMVCCIEAASNSEGRGMAKQLERLETYVAIKAPAAVYYTAAPRVVLGQP